MIRLARKMISVRHATVDDVAKVTSLCAAHAAYERAVFDSAGHAERLASAIVSTPPRAVILLAEIETMVVGYAAIMLEFSTWSGRDFLHMDCLFVIETARGQGVGRCLFDAVLRQGRRVDACEVQWQTPDWNTEAIRFYRTLGAADSAKARFVIKTS